MVDPSEPNTPLPVRDPSTAHIETSPSAADVPGRALVADTATGESAVASVEQPQPSTHGDPVLDSSEAALLHRLRAGTTVSALSQDLGLNPHEVIATVDALAHKLGHQVDAFGVGMERGLGLKPKA